MLLGSFKRIKLASLHVFVCSGPEHSHSMSPITPSELLIALHNVNCTNDETLMKSVIKGVSVYLHAL